MANHLSFPERLKRERDRRGWSQANVASKLGCDTKTVGRWEREGDLPRPEYRQRLCELFGMDAEELGMIQVRSDDRQMAPSHVLSEQTSSSFSSPSSIDMPDTLSTSSQSESAAVPLSRQEDAKQSAQRERLREDWGEAPRLENFYGRTQELAAMNQWIGGYHCRIVAVLGVGGVGKTAFTATLVEQLKGAFEYVFWRSLYNAPPLEHILQECIQFVSNQRRVKLPRDIDDQILLLLQYLRGHRCLLILDNLESLFQPGLRVGAYQEDYEGYGRLLRLVGETQHQSCLVLTSREKPREVVHMEGKAVPVRSLFLPGIGQAEGQALLKERGLFGSDEYWMALIKLYSGNSLALQLIAESIRGVFGGDIARFLAEEQAAFGDIHDLLEQQFHRLSSREREILCWLAIEREAISLEDIHKALVRPTSKGELLEALDALQRRSMIEGVGARFIMPSRLPDAQRRTQFVGSRHTDPAPLESPRFTLQPVIMEYVTNNLVKRACKEFGTESVSTWTNYAFIKARTKDYVRESQRRLILAPIAERLLNLSGKEDLEQKLKSMLSTQREVQTHQRNYLAGNVLNLLIHLQWNLRGFDFSRLIIRQAYLQQAALPGVNFAHAQFVESIFSGTFGNILSVAFSPNGDVLAAGTATGEIWVYQTRSGMPLLTCQGHTDAIWSLALSHDGSVLASSSDDQTIRLWDMQTGQSLRTLQGHTNRVRAVAFNPHSHILASGSDDQTIRLWNVATGECLTTLAGHADRVWSVAFSPDGQTLASGSTDQTIRLWDVATNQCLKTLRGHTDWVRSVVFHPAGRMLASGSDDQTVRLWDTESGNCLTRLHGHTNRLWSVAFSPDGHTLASGSEDQAIRLWTVDTGQCLKTLQEHTHGVRSVAFSPDGTMLASGGDDQALRLWEVSTGHCLEAMRGHTNRIWSVNFSPGGRSLASSCEDQTMRVWEVGTGLCSKQLRDPAHGVRFVTFSPDESILASCGEDQTVRLWNVSTGSCFKILQGHTNWVRYLAFSPNGSVLASGGEDCTIRLWNVNTGSWLQTLEGHTDWVRSIAFSLNGSILASGSDDQTIRLWDVNTGRCLNILPGHTNRIRSVAFHPGGSILASGSEDQTIRLWDVNSGHCFQTLQGHTNWVRSLAFSPDGSILASGSDDQTVRLWDMSTCQCLKTLRGHSSRVRSVDFSPEGDLFASGSDDGTIVLWDMQTTTPLRTLIGERPYERMNITNTKGLTGAQKAALRALGAIETGDEAEEGISV